MGFTIYNSTSSQLFQRLSANQATARFPCYQVSIQSNQMEYLAKRVKQFNYYTTLLPTVANVFKQKFQAHHNIPPVALPLHSKMCNDYLYLALLCKLHCELSVVKVQLQKVPIGGWQYNAELLLKARYSLQDLSMSIQIQKVFPCMFCVKCCFASK